MVGIALDKLGHHTHGIGRRALQAPARHHTADEHCRERVARAWEIDRDQVEGNREVLPRHVIVTDDGVRAVDHSARNDHRLGAQRAHGVHKDAGLVGRDLLCNRCIGEQTGLGVVGNRVVGALEQVPHEADRGLGHTGVELAVVAHDGVDEHLGALLRAAVTEVRNDTRLFLGHDKAGRDGVELKAEFLPDGETLTHVLRGVVDVELGIVERIGHQRRRQVVDAVAHMRQHRKHGGKRDLAIAAHIVDQQQLSVLHECPPWVGRGAAAPQCE
ncbi:unknown [Collinsella sp. CAG:166]|nr:unknown [Collinsella sp. CAG:166]